MDQCVASQQGLPRRLSGQTETTKIVESPLYNSNMQRVSYKDPLSEEAGKY
jgi:hypothetical protein